MLNNCQFCSVSDFFANLPIGRYVLNDKGYGYAMLNFIINSQLAHFFTNTLFFGTFLYCRGKANKIIGWLKPLLIGCSVSVKGQGNKVSLGNGKYRNLKIFIDGCDNEITFGDGCVIDNTTLWIISDRCRIVLDGNNIINHAEFGAQDDGSVIVLADKVLVGGHVQLGLSKNNTIVARMYASEGKSINLGKSSQVSDGTIIRTGDSHVIFGAEGERINYGKDVCIGSHVWVCAGAVILKGAHVADNCIVGAESLVTQRFTDESKLIAGNPARVVRDNVGWKS